MKIYPLNPKNYLYSRAEWDELISLAEDLDMLGYRFWIVAKPKLQKLLSNKLYGDHKFFDWSDIEIEKLRGHHPPPNYIICADLDWMLVKNIHKLLTITPNIIGWSNDPDYVYQFLKNKYLYDNTINT